MITSLRGAQTRRDFSWKKEYGGAMQLANGSSVLISSTSTCAGGKLEHTKYLRTLTRTLRSEEAEKYVVPGFAEPLDPLQPEKEILARYKAAERRLNKSFPAVLDLETSEKEKAEDRDYQRLWLKARDSGAEAFAALRSKEQRRCRKLQYLADATENRARDLEKFLENHRNED
jgi:uncharacterized protein YecT (DUF1311 family)